MRPVARWLHGLRPLLRTPERRLSLPFAPAALTTVLLIKSITEIVWLAVLILSVLALVFSLAATNMVPQERAVIMEAYTQELSFTTMGGVIGLALCLASYALYYIYTLIQVKRGLAPTPVPIPAAYLPPRPRCGGC